MSRALFAGSFDPFHEGHLAVLEAAMVDYEAVILCISHHPCKSFTNLRTRCIQIQSFLEKHGHRGVPIVINFGLTAKCAQALGCEILVRGYRNAHDFLYEQNLSLLNQFLGIKTRLYATNIPISSTAIKKASPR